MAWKRYGFLYALAEKASPKVKSNISDIDTRIRYHCRSRTVVESREQRKSCSSDDNINEHRINLAESAFASTKILHKSKQKTRLR